MAAQSQITTIFRKNLSIRYGVGREIMNFT